MWQLIIAVVRALDSVDCVLKILSLIEVSVRGFASARAE